jgi:hypothetical protein
VSGEGWVSDVVALRRRNTYGGRVCFEELFGEFDEAFDFFYARHFGR